LGKGAAKLVYHGLAAPVRVAIFPDVISLFACQLSSDFYNSRCGTHGNVLGSEVSEYTVENMFQKVGLKVSECKSAGDFECVEVSLPFVHPTNVTRTGAGEETVNTKQIIAKTARVQGWYFLDELIKEVFQIFMPRG
jgi:hypothetical protein